MEEFDGLVGGGSLPGASAVLTSQAVRGDRAAIAQLVHWYAQQGNPAAAAAWRGVYRGEAAAMFSLALRLMSVGEPETFGYAAYWFARVHERSHLQAGQPGKQVEGEV
jgi:hypothetical protein